MIPELLLPRNGGGTWKRPADPQAAARGRSPTFERRGNTESKITTILDCQLVFLRAAWHFQRQTSGYDSACC